MDLPSKGWLVEHKLELRWSFNPDLIEFLNILCLFCYLSWTSMFTNLPMAQTFVKKIIVFSLIQLDHLSIGFTETGHSSIGSDQPSTGSSYMMWLMAAAAVAFATGVAIFVTDPEFFVRFFRS